jgi:protein-S-isoprenylcysteine O-methyltransferase Ste14
MGMTWDVLNAANAADWAARLWMLLAIVWLVSRIGIKRAKQRETFSEFVLHAIPVLLGFWLLFPRSHNWGWLDDRLLPAVPAVGIAGLALTALGIGIGIWARLTLGRNWSGAVTLKHDHELIRTGLYRWIRHPIYTGILLGMVGTAMIQGHLRGWLGVSIVAATFYFKARREEKFLRLEFGAGFEEHARRTGMFLPKLT